MSVILVTGGAGYIGSHTCIALFEAGHSVIVLDDLSNSKEEVISRVEEISGKKICFYRGDVSSRVDLIPIFENHSIDCVIHFAAKKAVPESVQMPLEYYRNNIMATLTLCEVMRDYRVKNLVFSSSATVYGLSDSVPFVEDMPPGVCISPYGWTKWMNEQILRDLCVSDPDWSIHLLRYFNPVGAHPSGKIGEDPRGIPNNLLPYVAQVAVGRLKSLPVTGDDYPTPDGTGIRDYVHVMDIAEGHVSSVQVCLQNKGIDTFNLGTGKGYSVFEILHAFEKAIGHNLPYEITARRAGDIAVCYASTEKAKKILGWTAKRSLDKMCADLWNWQKKNPNGYQNGC